MTFRSPLVRTSGLAIGLVALSLSSTLARAGIGSPCGDGFLCTAPQLTGVTTTGSGHRDTTQAFAGINWNFGGGPELVVGVRALRTDASHKVAGARFEATFPFTPHQIGFDKLRLRLVGGHRSGMYELGGGYAFAGNGLILSGALQSDHVNIGTDLTVKGYQWQPFIGMNTLSRAKAPTQREDGTVACASEGETRVPASEFPGLDSALQLNGYTCVRSFSGPT